MVAEEGEVIVREFDVREDVVAVEEMERLSDMASAATAGGDRQENKKKKKNKKKTKTSVSFDLLGDPTARIRHFSDHVMLVADYYTSEKKEIVGVLRCCIKMVTRGRKQQQLRGIFIPSYTRIAYVLGLRVSPTHRRLGIGTLLVEKAEEWCRHNGAEYVYMATDRSNAASLNLFTKRLAYAQVRSLSVLVHPVHAHRLPLGQSSTIVRLPPPVAAQLYRRFFASSAEFFPDDIDDVLSNPLTLGTFLAVPSRRGVGTTETFPSSFAVMSLWNTKEIFRLQVKGIPTMTRALLSWAREADERVPWLRIPSVADFCNPFGVYFTYGLHMEGKEGAGLMRSLCRLAHNMARDDVGCAAVVAEVGRMDPMRAVVPHWRSLSWDEDVWCMKRLGRDFQDCDDDDDDDDWTKSQPSTDVIFVDPRDV